MDDRSPSPCSSSWTVPSPTQPHALPSLPLPNPNHHYNSSSSPSSYSTHSQKPPPPPRSSQSPSRMNPPPPPPPPNHQHRSSSTSSTATNSSTSHTNKLPKFLRRDKDKDKDKRRGSSAEESNLEGGDGRHERMTGLQQQQPSSSRHLSPPLDSTSSFSNGGPPSSYNSPPKKSKSKTIGRKGSRLFGGGSSSSSTSRHDAPPPPPKDDDPSSLHRSVSPASISTTSSSVAYNPPSDPTIIVEPPPSTNRRHLSSPAAGPPSSSRRSTSISLQTRPLSSVSSTTSNTTSPLYSHPNGNGSTSRLGDIVASAIPTRLGGWLSNLLPAASNGSTTSLAHNHTPIPPSLHQQQQQATSSPPRPAQQGQRSFVAAAKEKGAIMRYLLDSDAGKPEKCEEGIWVMGILHEGWRPPAAGSPTAERGGEGGDMFSNPISPPRKQILQQQQGRSSNSPASPGKFTNLFSSSTLSLSMGGGGNNQHLQEGSSSSSSPKRETNSNSRKKEEVRWPEEFFNDFHTSIWCTYRSQYAPITHLPPHLLVPSPSSYDADGLPLPSLVGDSIESMKRPPIARPLSGWAWVKGGGGDEKGLTTDSGWGCMLRTGQSLLANSLVRLHLGRDWRRPSTPPSESTSSTPKEIEDYATYVRIISWFMDDPLPHAPFSVHRMALVGKQLGKEVGEWFGPSTAAGAIRTLTNGYPHAALSVALAADAVIFRSDVYAASQPPSDASEGRKSKPSTKRWGGRAVLVLVGVRLGLDGVNPIYYESVKNLFTFPQSVGIAGGRPSSSYYFLGYQAESLFYLDPHHTRPAIVLKVPPTREELEARAAAANSMEFEEEGISFASESEVDTVLGDSRRVSVLATTATASQSPSSSQQQQPRSSSLTRTLSPEDVPLPATPPLHPNTNAAAFLTPTTPTSPLPPPPPSPSSKPPPPPPPSPPLDPLLEWYATAYPQQSLQTFHCEKVRKMAFSQLDPSMLLGFLCRNEEEWDDFCARVADMPNAIFSIADEPSSWDDDDDAGLESFSETDPDGMSSHSATTDDHDATLETEYLYDDDDDEQDEHEEEETEDLYASRSRSRSHVSSPPPPPPTHPLPRPHHPPPRQSTGSDSLVVVDDEDLGVELILNKNSLESEGTGSSSERSRLTPSTPTTHRPTPTRALGSEFELLEKDDWLEAGDVDDELDDDLEVEHLVETGRSRNQPILSSASMSMRNKKSSLPFPSPSKEEEEEEGFGFGEEERERERTSRARTVGGSGVGGRRRMGGGRATSGVTLKGLEEDGDDF
ncbi:peptidase family C54-domain-containing protein [Mrakia frigida]|uniref:cysteine protease ATG4 n=1 Tax=Mrakia frigida TaxID=29902 RepID=UPI003FCC2091